jgi:hypothetical protein
MAERREVQGGFIFFLFYSYTVILCARGRQEHRVAAQRDD